jgi:hypothetical protein
MIHYTSVEMVLVLLKFWDFRRRQPVRTATDRTTRARNRTPIQSANSAEESMLLDAKSPTRLSPQNPGRGLACQRLLNARLRERRHDRTSSRERMHTVRAQSGG